MPTTFFDLPRELRDYIYGLDCDNYAGKRLHPITPEHMRQPNLALTCRQIRNEVLEIFYGSRTICFAYGEHGPLGWRDNGKELDNRYHWRRRPSTILTEKWLHYIGPANRSMIKHVQMMAVGTTRIEVPSAPEDYHWPYPSIGCVVDIRQKENGRILEVERLTGLGVSFHRNGLHKTEIVLKDQEMIHQSFAEALQYPWSESSKYRIVGPALAPGLIRHSLRYLEYLLQDDDKHANPMYSPSALDYFMGPREGWEWE